MVLAPLTDLQVVYTNPGTVPRLKTGHLASPVLDLRRRLQQSDAYSTINPSEQNANRPCLAPSSETSCMVNHKIVTQSARAELVVLQIRVGCHYYNDK